MKNLVLIISLLFVACLSNSCKKDKDEPIVPETNLTPEKTAVSTFELIYVKAGAEVADTYPATIGSASITLNKSSDSTLFFIVPDIAAGTAQLNFELGSVQFTVAQTPEIIPNNVFTGILQSLDADIAAMSSDTAPDLAAIDTMLAFKAAMTAQFQALTDAEKRLNCMVYEANKNRFDAFRNSFDMTFDIAPEFRIGIISGCPDSPKKEKFTCFAKEIAFNAYVLSAELQTAANIIETDNIFGQFIPAGYLLIAGQHSRIIEMRSYLTALLNKKWIIDERMYNGVPTTYNNEEYTPLNLNPTVRTINPSEDVFLNLSDIKLFDNISDLKYYWDRLPFLGAFPPYVNVEEPTSLSEVIGSEDISVTNVSANAQHIGPIQYLNGNADVKFKTISGLTETFSFTLNFEKDGFLVTKRIENATLNGDNYTLEFGDYNPDYTQINTQFVLENGNSITHPNYVTRLVRLKKNGQVVLSDLGLEWRYFNFNGPYPSSEPEINIGNQHSLAAFINLDITVTNQAYNTIAGTTRTIEWYPNGALQTSLTFTFNLDGTYDVYTADGTFYTSSGYQFVSSMSPHWVNCSTYIINQPLVGAVFIGGATPLWPEYLMLNADGTISANGCDGEYVIY